MNESLDVAVKKQLALAKALEAACDDALEVLRAICPHDEYTTYPDPTSHRCNLCGDCLATDKVDGTGKVRVPHRSWTSG